MINLIKNIDLDAPSIFSISPGKNGKYVVILAGEMEEYLPLIEAYLWEQSFVTDARKRTGLVDVVFGLSEDTSYPDHYIISMLQQVIPQLLEVPVEDIQSHIDYYDGKV